MSKFDFLAALLDFGLTHVVEGILELLEVEDVAAVQLVSKLWYDRISLSLWAIQIIRDTFFAYFRPPPSNVTFGDTGVDPSL
jgi:hypothetical protein